MESCIADHYLWLALTLPVSHRGHSTAHYGFTASCKDAQGRIVQGAGGMCTKKGGGKKGRECCVLAHLCGFLTPRMGSQNSTDVQTYFLAILA
jgi:hypothetical protein